MIKSKLLAFALLMVSTKLLGSQIVPLAEFHQGLSQDVIIECPKGSTLPLQLHFEGEFLSLESPVQSLTLLKTCYVRWEGEDAFLFSTDLQTWKGFSDFFSGEISASLEAKENGPVATLLFTLNQRRN